MVTDIFNHPLDTLKTRIQMNLPLLEPQGSRFSGLHGLFRGVSTNLGSLPFGFIFFSVYDGGNYLLTPYFKKYEAESACHFLTGTLAEASGILFRNPLEVVKQQMQCGLDVKVLQTVKNIYRGRGIGGRKSFKKGFYAGFWSFIMRETPFSAIQMPVYELMKKFTLRDRKRKDSEMTFFENARNGGFSGMVGSVISYLASFFTNPIDVVKTRLMVNREAVEPSMLQMFLRIWKNEGLAGFFEACVVRMVSIGFASVLFFSLYEEIKTSLTQKLEGREKA